MTPRHRRKRRGVSLIETVAGMAIAIPVVLFIVDAVAMVIAQIAHDHLAKDCARAAAEEANATDMTNAINNTISRFNNPMLVVDSNTFNVVNDASGTAETVRVQTVSTFTLPVPIPFLGMDKQTFKAEATEPVVGVASK